MPKKSGPSPRKAPKQERSKSLVESIVIAATRVFRKIEFHVATTNTIAEVAGVSVGSLYQYFPNKDSLVGLLVDRRINEQLTVLEELLNNSENKSIEEIFEKIIRMFAQDSFKNRTFLRTLYDRGMVLGMVPAVVKTRKKACLLLEDFLTRKYGSRLQVANIPRAAFCLVNGTLGIITAAVVMTDSDPIEDEKLIQDLISLSMKFLFSSFTSPIPHQHP